MPRPRRRQGPGPLFGGPPVRGTFTGGEGDIQRAALTRLALMPWAVVCDVRAPWSEAQKLAHLDQKVAEFERKAACGPAVILWRQNSGVFFGRQSKTPVQTVIPGGSDISGMASPWGRRLELEMKTRSAVSKRTGAVKESAYTPYQKRFGRLCEVAGVDRLTATTAEEAVALVEAWLRSPGASPLGTAPRE